MKLSEVNRQIAEIREHMIPVTLTSLGDRYPKIIFASNHPKAGEIMSFKEAKLRAQEKGYNISKSTYYRIRKQFENSPYFAQTNPDIAYNIARQKLESIIDDFSTKGYVDEDDIVNLENLTTQELLDIIRNAAERNNADNKGKSKKEYSSNFHMYIQEELENLLKEKLTNANN